MNKNKIKIIIRKPIAEVFEFTTNPKNTHLWIPSISEEVAEEYPPKIGTIYKNRGENSDWNFYKVLEFKKNKAFILTDLKENYTVKYTYKKLDNNQTELIYSEWMKEGELINPFTNKILLGLRIAIENN